MIVNVLFLVAVILIMPLGIAAGIVDGMPFMGVVVSIVFFIAIVVMILVDMGVFPEPQRKCSKCGSKNTIKYLTGGGVSFSFYKRICKECGNEDAVVL